MKLKIEDALNAIKKLSKKKPAPIDKIDDIIDQCDLLEITDSDSFSGEDEMQFAGKNGLSLEYSFQLGAIKYTIWKKAEK
jgi:hypothetical protein